MKKIILFGAGGQSDDVRMVIKGQYEVVGFIDEYKTGQYHGLPILASHIEGIKDYQSFAYFVSIGDVTDKTRIFGILEDKGVEIINAIDKTAYISEDVVIGKGNYIGPMAMIAADVIVGDNNYINTGAIIEHCSRVGNHCRIAANATINGETIVQDRVFIGAGAIINGDMVIGHDSVIGSGSVVTKTVPPNVTVVGVPARIPL